MKSYLADAVLEPYLAQLPFRVELAAQRKSKILGEIGEKELDVTSLNEPIHKKFVNWPSTPEAILAFTEQFGLVDRSCKYSAGGPSGTRPREFSFSIGAWRRAQEKFQEFWDWNSERVKWEIVKSDLSTELMYVDIVGRPEQSHWGLEVNDIVATGPKPFIALFANSLWQFMCAVMMFYKVGDLRPCENPDCPAPRFIASRKNQIFCSNDCAGLVAKRRWWSKHGEQWREKRNKKRRKGGKR